MSTTTLLIQVIRPKDRGNAGKLTVRDYFDSGVPQTQGEWQWECDLGLPDDAWWSWRYSKWSGRWQMEGSRVLRLYAHHALTGYAAELLDFAPTLLASSSGSGWMYTTFPNTFTAVFGQVLLREPTGGKWQEVQWLQK